MKMEETQQERDYKMCRDNQEYQMRVLQMVTGSYHVSQPPLNMFPSYSGATSGNNLPYSFPGTSSPYSGTSSEHSSTDLK